MYSFAAIVVEIQEEEYIYVWSVCYLNQKAEYIEVFEVFSYYIGFYYMEIIFGPATSIQC